MTWKSSFEFIIFYLAEATIVDRRWEISFMMVSRKNVTSPLPHHTFNAILKKLQVWNIKGRSIVRRSGRYAGHGVTSTEYMCYILHSTPQRELCIRKNEAYWQGQGRWMYNHFVKPGTEQEWLLPEEL